MDYREVYGKALHLLKVRFLSEEELRRKLARYDVDDDVIDAVVDELKNKRFIDDRRLARAVYEQYARKGQYGHAYIVCCLRRRGLSVPDDLERVDEDEVVKLLVRRRLAGSDDPRKIARFLQYRGFSPSVIRKMIDYFYS